MKHMTVFLLAALVAPASAGPSPESLATRANTLWELAYRQGDAEALAGLYAEDAILVAPSLEIVSRRPGIRNYWAARMGDGASSFELEPINVRIEEDRLYQTAVWSADLGANVFDGEMTTVFVRDADGNWKIALQNFY